MMNIHHLIVFCGKGWWAGSGAGPTRFGRLSQPATSLPGSILGRDRRTRVYDACDHSLKTILTPAAVDEAPAGLTSVPANSVKWGMKQNERQWWLP